jgi:histidine phosphotransferase ChpT
MAEDSDAETKAFALDLIKKSAEQASAKLQFCRLAFGSAGSAGAQIDTGDAEKVARGFIEDGKVKLDWTLPRALLPKNKVKLLLNMLLIAGNAIPRGGTLQVDPLGEGGFQIKAAGTIARVPPAVPGLLAGTSEGDAIDAHAIQPFYTGLLAKSSGLALALATEGETIVLSAR